MAIYDLSYNSEMNELIKLNKKLKYLFDEIFKEYLKIMRLNGNFYELSREYFTNPKKRLDVINKLYSQKDKGIMILEQFNIEDIYNAYFEIEIQIVSLEEKIKKKLDNYEEACFNIFNNRFSKNDIDIYFDCLTEAYSNYLNKGFENDFTFLSSEMRNSIHSIETADGRKEIDVNLSIPHDKVLHLMELTSPNQSGEFFSSLYKSFVAHNEIVIECIKDLYCDSSDPEIESRVYMYFLQLYAPAYVQKILFDYKDLSDIDDIVIKDCLSSLKVEKDYNKVKKFTLDTIGKSFEKCINFRKMYEYKIIPEIVIDYDIAKARKGEENNFKNRTFSGAFTPKSKEGCVFLADCISKDNSSLGYSFVWDSFTNEEKNIINAIVSKLNTFNIYLPLDASGKKLDINNGSLSFIAEDSSISIGGYDERDSGLISYTYYSNTDEIKSDLPPSIFLMSYDDNEMEYESLISEACIYEAVIILCSIIADRLDFSYDKKIKKFNIQEQLAYIANNIKYAYMGIINNLPVDDTLKKKRSRLEKVRKQFQKKHRKQLIDGSSLIKIINSQLLEKKKINEKEKNSDERKKYEEDIKKYMTFFNNEELDSLIYHVSSYFKNDLSSSHFRKYFDIPAYIDYNSKCSENPYNDNGLENLPVDKPVYIKDETPMFSMIMKLAQHLKEEHECEYEIGTKRFDRTISMVGFGIKRKKIEDNYKWNSIIDKYPKTFMGKTPLQAICDLRINGWAYKLDAIYGFDNDGRDVYYRITPLINFSPILKKKYQHRIGETSKIDDDGYKKGTTR